MPAPFGSFPYDAAGIDNFAHPLYIPAKRAPTANDNSFSIGTVWGDESTLPAVLYTYVGNSWEAGGNAPATTTTYGTVLLTDNSEPVATKAYADALVTAGAPVATTSTSGIGKLVSDADAVARIASTGLQAYFVQPSNLTAVMAAPGPIGNTTASTGAFTGLTADGTGVVTLASSADATISTATGSFVVTAGESATDAVKIESTAGGIQILASGAAAGEDIQLTATGSSIRLSSTESATDSINIESTAGGIKILASGAAAGEDIVLTATGSSIRLTATESATDSINIESTLGGVNILASGASAGEDINITATGSSVNINSTENAALAIFAHANGGTSETIQLRADQGTGDASVELLSDVGGVTITAGKAAATAINFTTTDAAGGITVSTGTGGFLPTTTGKFTVISTSNTAQAIELHANGGTSETIRLRADQGTAVTSLDLLSDVGGITLSAGLGNADAINITTTNAAGGIDIDGGTAGVIVDTTGAISLDSAAASNFTVTGAFDLTLNSTAGSVVVTGAEAAIDAIQLNATTALGGIDVNAGTGGITVDSAGLMSLDAAGVVNLTTTGAFDITVNSTAGSIVVTGAEAAVDAIQLNATTALGGIDVNAGTGGMTIDSAGLLSIDSNGVTNLTATGAFDLTVNTTGGSLILRAGESATDAVILESTAGGVQILASGAAAGEDILVTATGSSITITATESVTDAMNFTANGAAGGINLTAGTNGILFSSGQKVKVTAVVTGVDATPYAILGTDYFLSVDTGAGVMTVTLPAAPATGRKVVVYDGGGAAAGSNITIDGNGKNIAAAGTSAATKLINTAYESYTLVYNGTLWLGQNVV